MNRNTELHFSNTPSIDLRRSKFEESFSHKTSFNTGDIIPVFVDADILPGDTVQMDMAELIRMATPIYPIMDNLYMDLYWFFVPHRLVWDHWQAFWGENDDPWTQTTPYEIPQINAPTGGWTEGTIADYMGIPTKVANFSINALPFRAYCKIWNDWFRDENVKTNCHIYTDETTRNGMTGTEVGYNYVTGAEFGGTPLKAAKFHDYYTSVLPEPQKGQPVTIPLGTTAGIYAGDTDYVKKGDHPNQMRLRPLSFDGTTYTAENFTYSGKVQPFVNATNGSTGEWGVQNVAVTEDLSARLMTPVNLYADLTNATAATINQLRTAFAIQKYYENAGLHGRAKAMCRV